jgi:single-stranded-DNA-specific exonuclease
MPAKPQAEPLRYRWEVPRIDPDARAALRQALGVSRIAAQALMNRGLSDPAAAAAFLDPRPGRLHDPFAFRDMHKAVDRIERAIAAGEGIAVYGDYDVDGVSGASLLAEFFDSIGVKVTVRIPDRFADGYGLTAAAVERLAGEGSRLVITADNGTSSHAAVARAAELGVDVIVTDHHEVRGELPKALAVLNPHRPDATYPERRLCGVGVAFKLCHAVLAARGEAPPTGLPERLAPLLDLVALGTVADVASLTGENRVLVRRGLELLSQEARPGIAALKEVAGLAGQEVGAGQVGFHLGPRINAGGRVADAGQGVRLLRTRDRAEADEAARYLDAANRERRAIEAKVLREVERRIAAESLSTRSCIVLADPAWHAGVLGIIASRVVERYHRPCVLIATDAGGVGGVGEGIGKGSGRSVPTLHLFEALVECEDLLLGYGGHTVAAGLTVEAGKIPELAERLDRVAARRLGPEGFHPSLRLDASARVADVTRGLVEELARLAPFGAGNPEPVLLLAGVLPIRPRIVGEGHLGLTLGGAEGAGGQLAAIAFGGGDWLGAEVREGVALDVAGTVSIHHWRGRETVQMRVRDIRPAG